MLLLLKDGTLRDDIYHWWTRIGIGLDIQLPKSEKAAGQRCDKQHQHDHALLKRERNNTAHEINAVRFKFCSQMGL